MSVLLGFIALAALIGVTIAPVVSAFIAWKWAESTKYGWCIHLLFIPTLLGIEWLGTDILFRASGDTGNGPPGLGLAIIPAVCVLLIVLLIYYSSLATIRILGLLRGRGILRSR